MNSAIATTTGARIALLVVQRAVTDFSSSLKSIPTLIRKKNIGPATDAIKPRSKRIFRLRECGDAKHMRLISVLNAFEMI